MTFYTQVLKQLISTGILDPGASTLIVAGGQYDKDCLIESGMTNVTISNLDVRMTGNEFAPFQWSFQDAENLNYADGSFEQVIEHAGLHHCGSPHRALLEMYRVARKRVLVFENRDSLSMKVAAKLGFTQEYEIEAVVGNECLFGGIRNTATPNYVYRWTEREIEKTIASHEPSREVSVRYFHSLRLPIERLAMHKSSFHKIILQAISAGVKIFGYIFPGQTNEFAFLIEKEAVHKPWIDPATGAIDKEYVRKVYR